MACRLHIQAGPLYNTAISPSSPWRRVRNSAIPTFISAPPSPPRAGQAGLWETRGICEVPRTLGNTGSFTLGFTTSRWRTTQEVFYYLWWGTIKEATGYFANRLVVFLHFLLAVVLVIALFFFPLPLAYLSSYSLQHWLNCNALYVGN